MYNLDMNNIDWIFFDVGGVLVDDTEYKQVRINALHRAVRIFDSRISRQQIIDSWPRASAMVGNLTDNLLSLFISDSQKMQMARNLLAGQKQAMFEARGKLRPETKEILEKLSKKYKLGLIANQPASTRKIMEDAGLVDYFAHFKVSDDHGFSKPDVRYFKAVLDETGADPERSMIIDDNIERGLLPAKKIGMTTVWYKLRDRQDYPKDKLDHIVTELVELLSLDEKISE